MKPSPSKIVSSIALAGMLVSASVLAEEWSDLRVSGTIKRSDGRDMAIVEHMDDGSSQLVSVGDAIASGRVIEISERWVRIAVSDGELRLPLEGGPGVLVPVSEAFQGLLVDRQDLGGAFQRAVDAPRLAAALAKFSSGASEEQASSEAVTFLGELSRALALPSTSQIVDVNDEPTASAAATLAQMQRILTDTGVSRAGILTLTLENMAGEMQRVYITLEDSGPSGG